MYCKLVEKKKEIELQLVANKFYFPLCGFCFPEDDPIAKRLTISPHKVDSGNKGATVTNDDGGHISETKVITDSYLCIRKLFSIRSLKIPILWLFFGFVQESQMEVSTIAELQKRLQIRVSFAHRKKVTDELKDKELVDLASRTIGEKALTNAEVLVLDV